MCGCKLASGVEKIDAFSSTLVAMRGRTGCGMGEVTAWGSFLPALDESTKSGVYWGDGGARETWGTCDLGEVADEVGLDSLVSGEAETSKEACFTSKSWSIGGDGASERLGGSL